MHVREFKGNSPPPLVDNLMVIHPIVLDPSKPPKIKIKQNKNEGEKITDKTESVENKPSDNSEKKENIKEDEREALTGIAYVPSARKNQRIFIRKDNVEHVVSLMFSKRRQLTEYEESDGRDFFDTSYEGRKRKSKKKLWKNNNLNMMKDAVKMRMECNDARLLVHEDYFSRNPNMAADDESDGEPDPNLAPVGVVPDTRPVPDNENNNSTQTNSNNSSSPPTANLQDTKTAVPNIDSPKSLAPVALPTPPPPQIPLPSFDLKIGTPFDTSSLASFPSISGKSISPSLFGNSAPSPFASSLCSPLSFGQSTTLATPFPQFSAFGSTPFPSLSPATPTLVSQPSASISPFTASFPALSPTPTLASLHPPAPISPFSSPSASVTTSDNQVTDIFGKQSALHAAPLDHISLFGNSTTLELGPKIGNSDLFQAQEKFDSLPEKPAEESSEAGAIALKACGPPSPLPTLAFSLFPIPLLPFCTFLLFLLLIYALGRDRRLCFVMRATCKT
jgi:hypothetical protein